MVDQIKSLNNLKNNLSTYDIDITLLNSILNETDSVIAGSFTMQAILGEVWEESDIDIWTINNSTSTYYSPIEPYYKYFNQLGYSLREVFKNNKDDSNTFDNIHYIDGNYNRMKSIIKCIYEFTKNEKKIQVIIIKNALKVFDSNINKYIYKSTDIIENGIKTFDIIACMVYYKNNLFYEGNEKSFEQVLSKNTEISDVIVYLQSPGEWFRTLYRIIKYCNRGYNIFWSPETKYYLQDALHNVFSNNDINLKEFINKWNRVSKENKNCNIPFINYSSEVTNISQADIRSRSNKQTHIYDTIKENIKDNYINSTEFDENNINFNKCLDDTFMDNELSPNDFLKENGDNLIFIYPGFDKNENEVFCTSIDHIYHIIKNKLNNFFFECKEEVKFIRGDLYEDSEYKTIHRPDFSQIYVKMPVDSNYNLGLVTIENLGGMLLSKNPAFYIIPKNDTNGDQIYLTRTVNWDFALSLSSLSGISSNHCQEGSAYLVYEILLCEGDKCTFTNKLNPKNIGKMELLYFMGVTDEERRDIEDADKELRYFIS